MVVRKSKASPKKQETRHGPSNSRKRQHNTAAPSVNRGQGHSASALHHRRKEQEEEDDECHDASDSDREESCESDTDREEEANTRQASESGESMGREGTSLNGDKSNGEDDSSGSGWESSESENEAAEGEDEHLPFLASDYTGVFRPAGQRLWKAIIRPDPLTGGDRGSGAVRHIGSFETEEEAAMAYDKVALLLHRKPVLNFPAAPTCESESPMDTDAQMSEGEEEEEEEEDEDTDREEALPALLEATSQLEGRLGRHALPRGWRSSGRAVSKEKQAGRSPPSSEAPEEAEADEGDGQGAVGRGRQAEEGGEQEAVTSHSGKGEATPAASMANTHSAEADQKEAAPSAPSENIEDIAFRGLKLHKSGMWRVTTSGSGRVPRNYLGLFGSKTDGAKLHDRAVSYLFHQPVLNFLPDGTINPHRLEGSHKGPCGYKHVPRYVLLNAVAAQQAASMEQAAADEGQAEEDSMDEDGWDSSSDDEGGTEEDAPAIKPSQEKGKGGTSATKVKEETIESHARGGQPNQPRPLLDIHTPTAYSHYRGVKTWKKGPRAGRDWVAYIYLKQVYTEIGVYKTQEEAARAYDRVAREQHGSRTVVNFLYDPATGGYTKLNQDRRQAARRPISSHTPARGQGGHNEGKGSADSSEDDDADVPKEGAPRGSGQGSAVKTRGAEKPRSPKAKPAAAAYTSQYRGVSFVPQLQTWRAQIRENGRSKPIGYFDREEDAARAFDRAAKRVRADPILNFIDGKLNPHRRASYRSRPSGGSDDDEEGGSGDEDEGATRMQVGEEGEEGEEKRAAEGPAKGRKRARTEMEESKKAADRPTSAKPAGGGKGEAKGKSGKARATQSSEADTASRFRGVRRREDATGTRWEARITAGKHSRYLGCFDTELQAALEYDRVAKQLHRDPVLNFVNGRLNPARKDRAVVKLKHSKSDSESSSSAATGSQSSSLEGGKTAGARAEDRDPGNEEGQHREEKQGETSGDGKGEEDGRSQGSQADDDMSDREDTSNTTGNGQTDAASAGDEKDDGEHSDAAATLAEEKEGKAQEQRQQPPPQREESMGRQEGSRRPPKLVDLTWDEEDEDEDLDEVQWLGGVRGDGRIEAEKLALSA